MNYSDNFNPTILNNNLFKEIVKEKKTIGYYNLVNQDTAEFKKYA